MRLESCSVTQKQNSKGSNRRVQSLWNQKSQNIKIRVENMSVSAGMYHLKNYPNCNHVSAVQNKIRSRSICHVILSPNFSHDLWVKVSLAGRLLLMPVPHNPCKCKCSVITSRTCIHSESYFISKRFSALCEALKYWIR